MYRPVFRAPSSNSPRWRQNWARLLAPITLWICVSVSLRYGYYGDYQMVLGPTSSRLLTASSLLVEQVEARVDDRKGVLLYGFSEKPELSLQTNWNLTKYLVVGSYGHKGFSTWLNKGSKIQMRLGTQTNRLDQIQLTMIKGERKYEELITNLTSTFDVPTHNEPLSGKEAEYIVEEEDIYYIGVINNNHRNIITFMALNVTSRMYNLTKANNICSTHTGSCLLKLTFPDTKFLVLTTPDTVDDEGDDWYIEIAFVARVVTYVAILALFMVIIILALKYLGTFDVEEPVVNTEDREIQYTVNIATETTPILRDYNQWRSTYGTSKAERENDEDDDGTDSSSSSSSSEDLYDAKLCVICYDDQRNCFFVPCGHCATCYNCAQRIMSQDNKMCPICRRLIHKVRRLFSP